MIEVLEQTTTLCACARFSWRPFSISQMRMLDEKNEGLESLARWACAIRAHKGLGTRLVPFASTIFWNKRISRVQATTMSLEGARGKKQQDFTVRYKRPTWAKTATPQTSWSKVVGLEKQARKTSNFVFRNDVKHKRERVEPWDSWAVWAKTSSTSTAKSRTKGKTQTSNFVFRDHVRKDEQDPDYFASEDAKLK